MASTIWACSGCHSQRQTYVLTREEHVPFEPASKATPMKKALFAALPLLALAGCSLSDPVVCPTIVPQAFHVMAQDSVSGANVLPGASVVARDGAYADSVVAPPIVTAMGVGGNRPGTYTVTVRQSGYQVWSKSGLKVEDGACGVRTVDVTARLQPAG